MSDRATFTSSKQQNTMRRLERLREEAVLGGVAAGLADYFKVDKVLFRVLFIVGIFLPHFPSLLIYIILWIALPERKFGYATTYESDQSNVFSNPETVMSRNNEQNGSLVGGAILIVIGLVFFLREWFDIDIDWGKLWPLFLIGLGVWLLVKDRNKPKDPWNDSTNSGSSYGGTYPPNNPQQPY